ncbi:uncharacterized protein BYT42DRAFT_248680 [Radiomyces spectabilis]|uniref:uncharacterized protein n=1 Tax=Radiomyces spectabilis TaxID=64574 RepID=UPI00221E53E3|nr:uncharacterized protein BYT42DRAFT_248680 [Radiomyces spectabilis]KAI8388838.1 hypothetical protein BYT42DRAFT_248680 [Radiomyces spectabilis]
MRFSYKEEQMKINKKLLHIHQSDRIWSLSPSFTRLIFMQKEKKNTLLHLGLLSLVQWISAAVIVLNIIALNIASENSIEGLFSLHMGPHDYLLIVLGTTSLASCSVLLGLYIRKLYQQMKGRSLNVSKALLTTEIAVSVMLIAFWGLATAVVMAQFNAASPCRISQSSIIQTLGSACDLMDSAVVLAFMAVGGWGMILLVALIDLTREMAESSMISTCRHYIHRLSHHDKHYAKYPSTINMPSSFFSKSFFTRKRDKTRHPYHDLDTQTSWYRHSLSSTTMVPVPADMLPKIQEGMSKLDVTF